MSTERKSIAVMAGAGTGKTYSLVENYLCSLFGLDGTTIKKRPQEILALTFTQKAANEMRLRINDRLLGLLTDRGDKDPLRSLAQKLKVDFPSREEIKRTLRALPNAWIQTFHGFCSSLLRMHAHSAGLDDNFEILFPRQELLAARSILRPIIIRYIEDENIAIQSLTARFNLGNKITSLGLVDGILSLYFKLFEKGIDCPKLIRATQKQFPNKEQLLFGYEDVQGALNKFFGQQNSPKTAKRLDDFLSLMPSIKKYILQGNESLLAETFKSAHQILSGNFGNKDSRLQLQSSFGYLAAKVVDYFVASDEEAVLKVITDFDIEFNKFKFDANVLSYSDLLIHTKDLLLKNLSLRRKLKHRLSHIMVDEYQDTSPLQEDILALLAENKDESKQPLLQSKLEEINIKGGSSIFLVGDKKQSIYGFRGADSVLFERMVRKLDATYKDSNAFTKRLLNVNRRSKAKIIKLVNLISRHTLASQGFNEDQALMPLDDDDTGQCTLWVNEDDDNQDKTMANLNCAVNGLAKLFNVRADLQFHEAVILVRRIKSATIIKQKLAALKIPSRVVGGDGFFQQQEIVDVLSALRLVANPRDKIALAVVLRSPLVLLSERELIKVQLMDNELSQSNLQNALKQNFFKESSATRLKNFFNALLLIKQEIAEKGLVSALNTLIDSCDLAYSIGLSENCAQKWANVEKLRTMFAGVYNAPLVAIDEFYERIDDDSKEPLAEHENTKDAVTIMTVHQSKGLEFKVVILADTESLLPAAPSDLLADKELGLAMRPKGRPINTIIAKNAAAKKHLTRFDKIKASLRSSEEAEMARVLYVALTRAKEELYITSSKASFEGKSNSLSLLLLFLRALKKDPESFYDLCSVEHISKFKFRDSSSSHNLRQQNFLTFVPKSGPIRVFASSLEAFDERSVGFLIKKPKNTFTKAIDGNLAHKLLAIAGNALADLDDVSENFIDKVLHGSLCALGQRQDEENIFTIKAAKITLLNLAKMFKNARQIIFEMPINYFPIPGLLIEGFADLVLEFDDSVNVIEFKSSYKAVTSAKTYLQALSYAHGLQQIFAKPAKYAVHLIQAKEFLAFQTYDDKARSIFLKQVKKNQEVYNQ